MLFKKFKIIDHTADIALQVYGKTLKELFLNSAYGMYNIICPNLTYVDLKQKYINSIKEQDFEILLVSFLNDLLYQTTVNKLLFNKFEIINGFDKKDNYLNIKFCAMGEIYNEKKHGFIKEIKAVTFHNLKIEKKIFFKTTIIFDI